MDNVTKIAALLLFFALVALVSEIFYFRRKRRNENTTIQSIEGLPKQSTTSFKKNVFVIIGLLITVFLLPGTVYVVFQQINLKKEAQTQQQSFGQLQIGCDQVDIVRDRTVVDPTSLKVDDLISFVGYCFLTTSTGALPDGTISKLRFTLTLPSGKNPPVEYLAFPVSEKNTATRRYFKATYPNVMLSQSGSFVVEVWGFSNQTGLSTSPFTKTFTVPGLSTSAPTPTQGLTQLPTGNTPPVCDSLSAIPLTGPTPLTASLTGTGHDSDGQVTSFEFTFGDGTKQTVNKNAGSSGSASTTHVYLTAGKYTASLRVNDNNNNISTTSALCQVTVTVTGSTQTASPSALKTQPTKIPTPTPTSVKLPQAGVSLPMVGFLGIGLIFLTTGLLFAF